jgi:hypothetical protein
LQDDSRSSTGERIWEGQLAAKDHHEAALESSASRWAALEASLSERHGLARSETLTLGSSSLGHHFSNVGRCRPATLSRSEQTWSEMHVASMPQLQHHGCTVFNTESSHVKHAGDRFPGSEDVICVELLERKSCHARKHEGSKGGQGEHIALASKNEFLTNLSVIDKPLAPFPSEFVHKDSYSILGRCYDASQSAKKSTCSTNVLSEYSESISLLSAPLEGSDTVSIGLGPTVDLAARESTRHSVDEDNCGKCSDQADFDALIRACKLGKTLDIEHALQQGFNVDIRQGITGNTLLHIAAANGHKKICRTLLRANADINAVNYVGDTALHCALALNYRELGGYLYSKGADDSIPNHKGETCYETARSSSLWPDAQTMGPYSAQAPRELAAASCEAESGIAPSGPCGAEKIDQGQNRLPEFPHQFQACGITFHGCVSHHVNQGCFFF